MYGVYRMHTVSEELEFQTVVSHTAWTLGTELETSVSALSAFNC